jgi:16S rRNA C967 or C1407 C5-methylase (RsmB/RsmF family)/NOL1/NOP2/fmu family ribosome biogenesis protein
LNALPEQLLRDLKTVKAFDEQRFREAHLQPAVVSVRLHPVKRSAAFAGNTPVPWCAAGRYLESRPVFTLDPLYHAGAYYVQEASSMFLDHVVRELLPERNDLRVLDLCGAPGGKSTLLASLLGKDSLLVCNEVIRTRASILEENISRWGYMNTLVAGNDPKDFGRLQGYFDLIVTDAPCSGSGLFRKDAAALNEWSEANVQLCSQRQQRILADVWPALKENGILVYATCSYSPQEDEQVLDWLAEEFDVETLPVPVPEEWGITQITSTRGMYGYRFFPYKLKGEGFFIAALRKKEETKSVVPPKFKTLHDKKMHLLAAHLLENEDWLCITNGEGYSAIRPGHEVDVHLLSKYVYLRRTGLPLGSPAGKEWLPAHDVALSIDRNPTLKNIEISREQALKFLKKEDAGLPETGKGWYIITHQNLGLGWVKALGNRFNNYLPKHWRIRMDINETE